MCLFFLKKLSYLKSWLCHLLTCGTLGKLPNFFVPLFLHL